MLLYWRVGLALATGVWGWPLLGWEKTAVIGWSGHRGVKARASSRGGALVWGMVSLARLNPDLQTSSPSFPEVRVCVVIGKKSAVSSWRHRSLTGWAGARILTWVGG